jgi:hypothetical protein
MYGYIALGLIFIAFTLLIIYSNKNYEMVKDNFPKEFWTYFKKDHPKYFETQTKKHTVKWISYTLFNEYFGLNFTGIILSFTLFALIGSLFFSSSSISFFIWGFSGLIIPIISYILKKKGYVKIKEYKEVEPYTIKLKRITVFYFYAEWNKENKVKKYKEKN